MVDKYEKRLEQIEMEIGCDLNTLGNMSGPAGEKVVDRIVRNLQELYGVYAHRYIESLREGNT